MRASNIITVNQLNGLLHWLHAMAPFHRLVDEIHCSEDIDTAELIHYPAVLSNNDFLFVALNAADNDLRSFAWQYGFHICVLLRLFVLFQTGVLFDISLDGSRKHLRHMNVGAFEF